MVTIFYRKKSNTSLWWIGAMAVAALIVGIMAWASFRSVPSDGAYDAFAQCITENGVVMYGAYWCPHCQNQKKIFGSSWEYVSYVECAMRGSNTQTKACQDAGIKGYPTWVFADGSRRSGELSFNELSEKSGCHLPTDVAQ